MKPSNDQQTNLAQLIQHGRQPPSWLSYNHDISAKYINLLWWNLVQLTVKDPNCKERHTTKMKNVKYSIQQTHLWSTGDCWDVSLSFSLRSPTGSDALWSYSSSRDVIVMSPDCCCSSPSESHASNTRSPTAFGHFLWGWRGMRSGRLVRNVVRSVSGMLTWPRISRSCFSVTRKVKGNVASSTSLQHH